MESVIKNEKAPIQDGMLLKASKIALIGVGLALLSGIITNVVNYAFSGEVTRIIAQYVPNGGVGATIQGAQMFGIGIQVAILGSFFWLAFSLRKSKTRAIAVNLIVFSSIFVVSDILTMVFSSMTAGLYESVYKGITSQELQVLTQSMYFSQALLALALLGWLIVLIAGIMGVRAPQSELEENSLV